ncbi:LPXTG cell wall anchor domain-containing protein [Collinsella sp. zg1085]|uniref:LPXTG cell wall anchor domain-containing protein n=1 Tax=Collinsella sp. zg1085 TaxID=2844380 RepID=UPI001C0E05AE|nr:LPXTG cell wall anchor domain-containing protein [Collinsella sp. zg1085]QWT17460.1 LPXTG cell wall anchor domain-containing protein [Collinsella sp. zg1085]
MKSNRTMMVVAATVVLLGTPIAALPSFADEPDVTPLVASDNAATTSEEAGATDSSPTDGSGTAVAPTAGTTAVTHSLGEVSDDATSTETVPPAPSASTTTNDSVEPSNPTGTNRVGIHVHIKNTDESTFPNRFPTVDLTRAMNIRLVDGQGRTYTSTEVEGFSATFSDLPAGIYTVEYAVPEGYMAKSGKVGTGSLGSYTLPNARVEVRDTGVFQPFYIRLTELPPANDNDTVPVGTNKAQVNVHIRTGVEGANQGYPTEDITRAMSIELVDAEGHVYTVAEIKEGFRASFLNIPTGTYKIRFVVPEGYESASGETVSFGAYKLSGDTLEISDNKYVWQQFYVLLKAVAPDNADDDTNGGTGENAGDNTDNNSTGGNTENNAGGNANTGDDINGGTGGNTGNNTDNNSTGGNTENNAGGNANTGDDINGGTGGNTGNNTDNNSGNNNDDTSNTGNNGSGNNAGDSANGSGINQSANNGDNTDGSQMPGNQKEPAAKDKTISQKKKKTVKKKALPQTGDASFAQALLAGFSGLGATAVAALINKKRK